MNEIKLFELRIKNLAYAVYVDHRGRIFSRWEWVGGSLSRISSISFPGKVFRFLVWH